MFTAWGPGLALGECPEQTAICACVRACVCVCVCVCVVYVCVCDLPCGLLSAPGTECSSFANTQEAAIISIPPEEFVFPPTLHIAQIF